MSWYNTGVAAYNPMQSYNQWGGGAQQQAYPWSYYQQQSYPWAGGYQQQDPWAAYYQQQQQQNAWRPQGGGYPGGGFPGGGFPQGPSADDFMPRQSSPEPSPPPPEPFIPQGPPQEMPDARKKPGGIFGMLKTGLKWALMAAGVAGIFQWVTGSGKTGGGDSGLSGVQPSPDKQRVEGSGDTAIRSDVFEIKDTKGKRTLMYVQNQDGQLVEVPKGKVKKNPEVSGDDAEVSESKKPKKKPKKKSGRP